MLKIQDFLLQKVSTQKNKYEHCKIGYTIYFNRGQG